MGRKNILADQSKAGRLPDADAMHRLTPSTLMPLPVASRLTNPLGHVCQGEKAVFPQQPCQQGGRPCLAGEESACVAEGVGEPTAGRG